MFDEQDDFDISGGPQSQMMARPFAQQAPLNQWAHTWAPTSMQQQGAQHMQAPNPMMHPAGMPLYAPPQYGAPPMMSYQMPYDPSYVALLHSKGFFPYSQYHPMMGVVPKQKGPSSVSPTTALIGVILAWWALTKDE